MKKGVIVFFIIFLVGLDQLSKFFISSHLNLGESLNIFPFLNFTLIHNTGIAFSIFDDGEKLLGGSWQFLLQVF